MFELCDSMDSKGVVARSSLVFIDDDRSYIGYFKVSIYTMFSKGVFSWLEFCYAFLPLRSLRVMLTALNSDTCSDVVSFVVC
jgi:hypothetical protein